MIETPADLHKHSYRGEWDAVLAILRARPEWVNEGTEGKSYTALHQAAWHGAEPAVVGALLALGADRSLCTANKRQTAADIAADKHPEREDLAFLLRDAPRTAAQLLRKAHADDPTLFTSYDGNWILFDRIVDGLGADMLGTETSAYTARLAAAYHAAGRQSMESEAVFKFTVPPIYDFTVEPALWRVKVSSRFASLVDQAHTISLARPWATIADLFIPLPEQSGSRGNLFLKIEMAQSLCHVPIPEDRNALRRILDAAFLALTGVDVTSQRTECIKRFDRGGMSSGHVSCETWNTQTIPTLLQRADWLHQSWRLVRD